MPSACYDDQRQWLMLTLFGPLLIAVAGVYSERQASAEEALLAVASNVLPVARSVQTALHARTKHRILITSGSSGQLYAQIRLGSPADAFISADRTYIDRLEELGVLVPETRFTYAIGRLALISRDGSLLALGTDALRSEHTVRRIAIPNPNVAPYGLAAQEALSALGFGDQPKGNLVLGENVGQTFAVVHSGNAQLGIVALSIVLASPVCDRLAYRVVPSHMHSTISQDAALLVRGKKNAAAISFLNFFKDNQGQQLLRQHGYELP